MSTYPGQPAAPKKTLTWIAIACFALAVIVTGFFAWRIVVTAPRSPQPIAGGTVHLKKEGLTVYASVPALRPPCEAKDAAGNDVPLKGPSGSETITINGDSWYVVARSVRPAPAGDYTISCKDTESSATYAAGPRSSVVAFVVSILATILSFLIFVGLGVVFLVISLIRNHRRNRAGNGPGSTFPTHPQPPNPGQNFPSQSYNPGPNPDRPQDR
ncbi:hypothetical protein [Kribbella solani]|uniref:hypothetical protein n=1 Tax=Kribbella solani TaxID=236067 RepID=UPI0029BF7733|nr:hypothetical protein [Kribbella solani]MDX2974110.1 hypothetical protein [Kribbella solani]